MGTELIDTSIAAELCGISQMTLRKWRTMGSGPQFVKLGRSVRYRREDILAFIAERVFGNTTEADFASNKQMEAR